MDHCAAICLAFPPEPPFDDSVYDKAVKAQLVKLTKLLKEPSQPLKANGNDLLQLLDPAVNSLSYLAVIHSLFFPNISADRDLLLEKLVIFLLSFDARQIRYAGVHLLEMLNLVASGQLLPPSVTVQVLATAILRIDPTASVFTSTHVHLVRIAYATNNVQPALPVIDKSIVFYPGMANQREAELLSDLSLSPAAYVSKDAGLTSHLRAPAILEYDILCGMIYCAQRDWGKALAAFERLVTYPTRDQGISKIMVEAFKKWVLVSLLYKGRYEAPPAYTGAGAAKSYNILGKLYKDIANIFETEDAAALKAEVDRHTKEWQDDGNLGLIGEVQAAYQEWKIVNLQQVYTKISIPEIRHQTNSAQTGSILAKDEDVETLIQNMVISGRLKGVIEKNDDGVAFLTFMPSSTALSEVDFAKQIAGTAMRLKALQPVFKATNERLGTSKEYIKHLVKEQQRGTHKEGHDATMGFDSQVDDEDLMGGITSTA
ncbi:hypothetical protein BJ170DRAFT_189069 [Xylariales sp. AK1849]|nr:hypothetical protein BJ170DRAFT_189069 [Xylariales sp. AK1849]